MPMVNINSLGSQVPDRESDTWAGLPASSMLGDPGQLLDLSVLLGKMSIILAPFLLTPPTGLDGWNARRT